jgi:hypothetical protein
MALKIRFRENGRLANLSPVTQYSPSVGLRKRSSGSRRPSACDELARRFKLAGAGDEADATLPPATGEPA